MKQSNTKLFKLTHLYTIMVVVFVILTLSGAYAFAAVPRYPYGQLAIHRFYNTKTLSHFYTPDEDEVARIKSDLPDFKYEGIKYNGFSDPGSGRVTIYRFYNTKTLSHFYSSDINEVNFIRANLADFNYEGPSYYAESAGALVYRFYNTRTLTHLYTADSNEVSYIRSNLPEFRYEGFKFGAVESKYYANCTAVIDAGRAPIYRGQVGYGTHLDRDSDGIACEIGGK